MTILKARNGQEIDTTQFDGKPYGVFTNYVRHNIDSKWQTGDLTPCHYLIEFKGHIDCEVTTELEIEAENEGEAREKGMRKIYKEKNLIDWQEDTDQNITDINLLKKEQENEAD